MCGILGFNWKDVNLAFELNNLLAHRGPDQKGVFFDDKVTLAHRRLSIIDLSEQGIQPMVDEKNSLQIVYNGEIFNFKNLRALLQEKGYSFRSQTDTEVLLYLYREFGKDMLKKLNGQFAFCIYDIENQKLFLARDRFGILPLFYYFDENKFIFSSELKAILRSGIKKDISYQALSFYLRFGYISAPRCIIKNTFKLCPGHFLIFDLKQNKIKENAKYWDFEFHAELKDKQEASQKILDGLSEAVKMRLVADVPVGAFLSGGVDSSAVVALIKKFKPDLKTFSVKFLRKKFDESSYAKRIAQNLDTEHYEIKFNHKDVKEIIFELSFNFDEPFGDSSAIPTYLVSKIARKHVTVCLSGDGGDELLAGYNRYRYYFIARRLNHLPRLIKFLLRITLKFINLFLKKFEIERIIAVLAPLRLRDLEIYEKLCEKIDFSELQILLNNKAEMENITRLIKTKKGPEALQDFDIVNYLEGDILTKVDRAAMAVNLETRPPFLDHNFFEHCLHLHRSLKIKGKCGKWIFKKAFEGILPKETLKRKKKGFSVPIKHYLKKELRAMVEKYVLNYQGHDYFNLDFLKKMDRGRDNYRIFYNIMMFNLWHEKWIKAKK